MSDQNKNSEVEVTQDELIKALEVLGLSIEGNDLQKGEGAAHEAAETSKEEKEEKTKGDKDEKSDEDDDIEKASKEVEDMEKAFMDKKSALEELKKKKEPKGDIQKSENEDLMKGIQDSLDSKLGDFLGAIKTVVKATNQENQELKKSLGETQEMLGKLNSVVVQMANQSLGRKSIPTVNAIEKSMGDNELAGKKVLSLSKDKAQIEAVLFDLSGIEKGEVNTLYANEAVHVNTSGMISKAVEDDLFKNHNIKIVQ